MKTIVVTVISPDRQGIVKTLSETIVRHEGNWGESSMANLAGQFAGILTVKVDDANLSDLRQDLLALSNEGMTVAVSDGDGHGQIDHDVPVAWLEITGHDRPGIVQEVANACAQMGVNVLSLETAVSSGSMSGEAMFEAMAEVQLTGDVAEEEVKAAIEALSDDLMVDVHV